MSYKIIKHHRSRSIYLQKKVLTDNLFFLTDIYFNNNWILVSIMGIDCRQEIASESLLNFQ